MGQTLKKSFYNVDSVHQIVLRNNNSSFKALLTPWIADISSRTSKDNNPLLLCLKHQISDNFIKSRHLLSDDPFVDEGLTMLLWLAAKNYRYPFVVQIMLSEQHAFEVTGMQIRQCADHKNVDFIDFLTNRRLNIVHVALKKIFCDLWNVLKRGCGKFFKCDNYSITHNLRRVCMHLFKYVVLLIDAIIFKSLRPVFYRQKIENPFLLTYFYNDCYISTSGFCESLCLILNSPEVGQYLKNNAYYRDHLIRDMINMFQRNQVVPEYRTRIIYAGLQWVNVNIFDIENMYASYLFNEEVVILLHHINFEDRINQRHERFHIRRFIMTLERNTLLNINKLKDLNLIYKKAYHKLLRSMPEEPFNENVKMKLQVLSGVPSLYEISNYQFQRFVQKVYRIHTHYQFCLVLKKLNLPYSIKRAVCYKPPLYC